MWNRLSCLGAAALLMAATALRPANAQSPGSVLVIEQTTLDDDGMVTVLLHNEGSKTISEYTLLDAANPGATHGFFAGLAMELLARQGLPKGLDPPPMRDGPIHPGQSTSVRVGRHGSDFPLLTVAAIVFEDRTAIGDEKLIRQIFQRRSEEAVEYAQWCPSLAPERLEGKDRSAVISLLAQLESEIRKAPPIQDAGKPVRENLLRMLEQRSRPGDPMMLVTILRAFCTTAAAHSQRKEAQ